MVNEDALIKDAGLIQKVRIIDCLDRLPNHLVLVKIDIGINLANEIKKII
jgi:hypothetical protein